MQKKMRILNTLPNGVRMAQYFCGSYFLNITKSNLRQKSLDDFYTLHPPKKSCTTRMRCAAFRFSIYLMNSFAR